VVGRSGSTSCVTRRWAAAPVARATAAPPEQAADGVLQGGIALLERNLFGECKELGLVGVYSSNGQTALALYRDPTVGGSRAILAAELVAENKLRQRVEGTRVT
jgi:hypothetical protein